MNKLVTQFGQCIDVGEAHLRMNGLLDTCSMGSGTEVRISIPYEPTMDVMMYSKEYYVANDLPGAAEGRQLARYVSLSSCFDVFEMHLLEKYNTADKLRVLFSVATCLQNTMCIRFVVRAMMQMNMKIHAKS